MDVVKCAWSGGKDSSCATHLHLLRGDKCIVTNYIPMFTEEIPMLLKEQYMGVPQRRHRVFFVALRKDARFDLERLDMSFNYELISYGEIKEGAMRPLGEETDYRRLTLAALPEEKDIGAVNMRLHKKLSGFQTFLISDDSLVPTLRTKPEIIDRNAIANISKETIRNAQTFPRDYDFNPNTVGNIAYICGMSVPPIMIKRIVTRLIESGVFAHNFT